MDSHSTPRSHTQAAAARLGVLQKQLGASEIHPNLTSVGDSAKYQVRHLPPQSGVGDVGDVVHASSVATALRNERNAERTPLTRDDVSSFRPIFSSARSFTRTTSSSSARAGPRSRAPSGAD